MPISELSDQLGLGVKTDLQKIAVVLLLGLSISACSSNSRRDTNEPALAAAKAGMRVSEEGQILTMNDLRFKTNQSRLDDISNDVIMQASRFLSEDPSRTAIIKGHADSTGGEQSNIKLSTHRAFNVRNALIAQGIDASRIEVVAMGENSPIASNDTADGRQANRRVEILFPY